MRPTDEPIPDPPTPVPEPIRPQPGHRWAAAIHVAETGSGPAAAAGPREPGKWRVPTDPPPV